MTELTLFTLVLSVHLMKHGHKESWQWIIYKVMQVSVLPELCFITDCSHEGPEGAATHSAAVSRRKTVS
jgi:hypothetical protein